MRQLVQTLQTALEKEKIKVKTLTEQVSRATACADVTIRIFDPCRALSLVFHFGTILAGHN